MLHSAKLMFVGWLVLFGTVSASCGQDLSLENGAGLQSEQRNPARLNDPPANGIYYQNNIVYDDDRYTYIGLSEPPLWTTYAEARNWCNHENLCTQVVNGRGFNYASGIVRTSCSVETWEARTAPQTDRELSEDLIRTVDCRLWEFDRNLACGDRSPTSRACGRNQLCTGASGSTCVANTLRSCRIGTRFLPIKAQYRCP